MNYHDPQSRVQCGVVIRDEHWRCFWTLHSDCSCKVKVASLLGPLQNGTSGMEVRLLTFYAKLRLRWCEFNSHGVRFLPSSSYLAVRWKLGFNLSNNESDNGDITHSQHGSLQRFPWKCEQESFRCVRDLPYVPRPPRLSQTEAKLLRHPPT